ncbi:MAG: exopolysaccharide biosynthesis polyprenyl glycosylphosphotransferase [Candidatus Magasanikbacteria bacterium]|jgi:exopolysaccharide biosynthesis polyprenyl glycosylphosphotransferase|nr:exopolysaccharide biosynthesis polyprenyl glycosylphosphotransferase [Candidatus Magasanikbacteria bacterium]MBT5262316.1 exopolysaccharide biosynthesis polyprenyl glycosylphosphotransferase [Candidatus Magasanikbacteria bacterium]MBT5820499.1 exopolysaccharide biosynthesis polyprenyl glycosylphosphotransferase [Candidatus Magasanikbacteria bacterium]
MHFLYRIKQFILLSSDTIAFALGLWGALCLRKLHMVDAAQFFTHLESFWPVFLLWLLVNYINGLYSTNPKEKNSTTMIRFVEVALLSTILGIVYFYSVKHTHITPKTILIFTGILGYMLSFGLRKGLQPLLGIRQLTTKVLFVGFSEDVAELLNGHKTKQYKSFSIVGIIDPEEKIEKGAYPSLTIYQSVRAIRPAISTHDIDLVVIDPKQQENSTVMRELYELLFWNVHVTQLPHFFEEVTGRISAATFSESWFLEHLQHTRLPIYEKVREIIDYAAGVVLLLILFVLLPFVATAIKLSSKGPVFYKQKRVGKSGKVFDLYKFRSMYALNNEGGAEVGGYEFTKKNDSRITFVGKFLRKTRIDEIPQAINLFKRDLSLIGPRPERPEIVEDMITRMAYYPLRHVVLPGITGWAVLHQHYADSHEKNLKKLQYDLYYIKNRSAFLDMTIMLKTVNIVLRGLGQ